MSSTNISLQNNSMTEFSVTAAYDCGVECNLPTQDLKVNQILEFCLYSCTDKSFNNYYPVGGGPNLYYIQLENKNTHDLYGFYINENDMIVGKDPNNFPTDPSPFSFDYSTSNYSIVITQVECTKNADCGAGLYCSSGSCLSAGNWNTPCSGQECETGLHCVGKALCASLNSNTLSNANCCEADAVSGVCATALCKDANGNNTVECSKSCNSQGYCADTVCGSTGNYCTSTQTCMSNGTCCETTNACGSSCCTAEQICTNGQCCSQGETYVAGQCCLSDNVCGTSCCASGQVCSNKDCVVKCGDDTCGSGQSCRCTPISGYNGRIIGCGSPYYCD
jgi:hypothetical protein